jgi:hypothetical protein
VLDLGVKRHVHDAVRSKRDQCLDVIRGPDAKRPAEPHEVACILADLFLAERVHAHQFKVRAFNDRPDGLPGDKARGPLNDSGGGH